MAAKQTPLEERALEMQAQLEQQGLRDAAQVVAELLKVVLAGRAQKQFYTTGEAAQLVGVTGQTIKNWVSRGILTGYRLGGRIVIPARELEGYRPLAEASKALEPTPDREELVEAVRAGRRRFVWPEEKVEPCQ